MSTTRRKANAARDAVSDQLREEGVQAAYRRAIKILNDDSAPATAHASLVKTIFQASGIVDLDDEAATKEPHEMSPDELDAAVETLKARMAAKEERGSVFG